MLAEDSAKVFAPPRHDFSFGAAVTAVAFLADGTLAAALGDGTVRLIAAGDGAAAVAEPHQPGSAILTMTVDVDGAGVLTGGDDGRFARTDSRGSVTALAEFPGQQIDVLAASAAGALRAVAAGREVRLLDRHGKTVAATADHPSTVTGLAFNPKGKRLAVSHYGGATLWWTGRLGHTPLRLEWRGSHIGVTWSPDGSTVLTAMQECELHGWPLAGGEHMRMTGYTAKVRSLDWAARPMALVTSGSDRVIAWSFTGPGPMGRPPLQLAQGLGRLVTCVAVRPKQPLVAAGFDDGQVIVCPPDADDRTVRLRQPDGMRVTALAWSRDGARIALGTDAGAVALFDLSKGTAAAA